MSDKGDIQNMQSGGSPGTGLKTTDLRAASELSIPIGQLWAVLIHELLTLEDPLKKKNLRAGSLRASF